MMFYKETNFKETPIGRIPKEWEVVKLGDDKIAEIRGNKIISAVQKVAFIPMELIPDHGIFVKYEIRDLKDVSSSTYCEAGDLLLAKITPSLENGKQGIVPDDIPNGFALATTEVYPIVCKGIDRLFLFYVLKFPRFRKILEFSMRGTTGRQRVPKDAVEKLKIPLPPYQEQKRIAEILSTVDEAIQKTNEIIAKTERLKKGLMQELLTKGLILGFMFDTNIFNAILNEYIDLERLPRSLKYYVTHIQYDEICSTQSEARKRELLKIIEKVPSEVIATEGVVCGVSKYGMAKFMSEADAKLYDEMLRRLKELDEKAGKKKPVENQARDVLIALTSIKNCLILVTEDKNLKRVTEEFNGQAITFEQFQKGEYREFKDSEIGRIPKNWEVVKINKLFDLYKGTTPSTKNKEYWNGNIPFVTPTDITKINDSNEMYLKTTENCITKKGLKSKGLKLVPKDSLLFTSRATIGYLAINKTEVAINQGIISLIPKDANIDVTFFYYLLQKLKNFFENLAGGSTYKEISMSTFSNVIVPLPPYQEQQKIAEILSTVDKKLEIERNEKAKLERIKRGLMDLLLTGKIRVKVNSNG